MPSQVEADADKRDHLGPRSAAGAVADSSARVAHAESGRGRRGQARSPRAALGRRCRGRQLGPGGSRRVRSRPTRTSEITSGRARPLAPWPTVRTGRPTSSQVEADADKRDHLGPRSAAGAVADSSARVAHAESGRGRRGQARSSRAAPGRRCRSRQLGPGSPRRVRSRPTRTSEDHLGPRSAAGAVADSSARVAHAESGRGRRGQARSPRAALGRWRRGRQFGPRGSRRVRSRPTRTSEITSGRARPLAPWPTVRAGRPTSSQVEADAGKWAHLVLRSSTGAVATVRPGRPRVASIRAQGEQAGSPRAAPGSSSRGRPWRSARTHLEPPPRSSALWSTARAGRPASSRFELDADK